VPALAAQQLMAAVGLKLEDADLVKREWISKKQRSSQGAKRKPDPTR